MINRALIEKTIGKTFADVLEEPLIDNGELMYSRRSMVEELGCANFVAAVRLSVVLKKLKITSAAALYKTDPQSLVRVRGIGAATLFVAMCILEAHEYDVEKWWGWNNTNVVKFSTFKHQILVRGRKRKHEVA